MAGDTRNARSERDPQTLVADLLRRATSPEVLAGVAGAAAAARFTKRLVEEVDDPEVDGQSDSEESDGTHETLEDEPAENEHDEPGAEEDEPDDDEQEEPNAGDDQDDDRDEARAEEEQEPEAAADPEPGEDDEAAPKPDEEAEERAEKSESSANGSGTDDERMELLDRARRYAEQLTGHPVESFSSLERDDRGWHIGVEVVELSRVPSTTDVLGSYELVLTDDGEFVDFRRSHRYSRNSTDDVS